MPQQTTLPFFKQKRVITSFNVPRRYQMPVAMLRASCFLPALFYTYQYWKLASLVPLRDAGGPRLIQITQTEYYVAILWRAIGVGYLGTSMMNKWFYQYEFKQAITCLATLNFGICCLSVLFNSHFIDPVRSQLAFCIVLFVCNVLKLVLASSPKYSQKIEDVIPIRFKTPTALNILVLPFIITLAYSVFLLVGQAYRYEYTSDLLMKKGVYNLDTIVAPSTTLILILSSWEGADKRKVMRDTTLNWLKHKNVSYRFIIGQQPSSSYSLDAVKEESEAYNDLLIVPASDLKQDKSHKLYEAFKWSSLAQYDYLIKTDDDVFVRWDIVSPR